MGLDLLLDQNCARGGNPTQFSLIRIAVGAVAILAIVALTGSALPRRPQVWLRLLLTAFLVDALPVQLVPDATGEDVGVYSTPMCRSGSCC